MPLSGEIIYATDVNPNSWTAFVPTLTQGVTVTKTVNAARFHHVGKLVTATISLTVTGAGTAGQTISVGLPVTAAGSGLIGVGDINRAGTHYVGTTFLSSSTAGSFIIHNSTNYAGTAGGVFTFGLGANDVIYYAVTYEAA